MKERSVIHGTFVIERRYAAAPGRVFGAFADPAKKRKWFAEGEELPVEVFEMEFREGGRESKTFRLPDGRLCRNDTVYLDIVPNERIVFAYTMTLEGQRISSSQATTEFVPAGNGTKLIFTEQGAFFEGSDGPQLREGGWRALLERLGQELEKV